MESANWGSWIHGEKESFRRIFIKSLNPSLNEQLDTELLVLFNNDVTWS